MHQCCCVTVCMLLCLEISSQFSASVRPNPMLHSDAWMEVAASIVLLVFGRARPARQSHAANKALEWSSGEQVPELNSTATGNSVLLETKHSSLLAQHSQHQQSLNFAVAPPGTKHVSHVPANRTTAKAVCTNLVPGFDHRKTRAGPESAPAASTSRDVQNSRTA